MCVCVCIGVCLYVREGVCVCVNDVCRSVYTSYPNVCVREAKCSQNGQLSRD